MVRRTLFTICNLLALATFQCGTVAIAQTQQAINLTVPASTQPSVVTITVSVPSTPSVTPSTRPATQPTSQPSTQPTPLKMAVGTNIAGNDPWQTYSPWCDVTHQATGWTPGGNDPPIAYGPGGYPQTPAFAHLWLYGYPSGVYHFHFAAVSSDVLSIAGKSIANLKTVSPGVFEGDVTFATGDFVNFRATGPVSDVHLYTPDNVAGQTFRKVFTDAIRPYKVLRLMPWARVNGEMPGLAWPLQWSQRNLPTNWDQTTKEVALEYQLELAKESGAVPWINTYYGESDDALTQTANLVKSYGFPLVIVESENEFWNQAGAYQGNQIRNDGVKAGLATDPNVAGARLAAQTGAHVVSIFRGVLGQSHVKGVFGAQATWGAWASDGLTFVPPGSFDALAVAPYFNNVAALPPTATSADWEASCSTWINTILDNGLAENQAAAQAAGVELICYEGGQSLFPLMANAPSVPLQDTPANLAAFNADFMTAFQTDPAMGRLYDSLFGVCRKHNVTLFTHFYLCGYFGRGGYWGAKQFLGDPDGPKGLAIQRAILAGNN